MGEANAAENIRSGFRATGICPLSREHVLAKLPSYAKPTNVQEAIGEEFKKFLEDLRKSELALGKQGQKFQLPVVPGKSVSSEEVEQFYRNREQANSSNLKPRKRGRPSQTQQIGTVIKKSKNCDRNGSDSSTSGNEEEFFESGVSNNNTSNIENIPINVRAIDMSNNNIIQKPTLNNISDETSVGCASIEIDVADSEKIYPEGEYIVLQDGPIQQIEQKYLVGDYVIIKYENQYFPGCVTEYISKDNAYTVNAMERSANKWKWPTYKDEIIYLNEDVIKKIDDDCIIPVSNRNVYEIRDVLLN